MGCSTGRRPYSDGVKQLNDVLVMKGLHDGYLCAHVLLELAVVARELRGGTEASKAQEMGTLSMSTTLMAITRFVGL